MNLDVEKFIRNQRKIPEIGVSLVALEYFPQLGPIIPASAIFEHTSPDLNEKDVIDVKFPMKLPEKLTQYLGKFPNEVQKLISNLACKLECSYTNGPGHEPSFCNPYPIFFQLHI